MVCAGIFPDAHEGRRGRTFPFKKAGPFGGSMPLISLKALIDTVIKWTQVKNEPSSLRAKPHAAQHQLSCLLIKDNMMTRDR